MDKIRGVSDAPKNAFNPMILGSLQLGGVFSGIDSASLIERILDVQRVPITNLQDKKNVLAVKKSAYSAVQGSLSGLKSALANLKDPAFFSSKIASSTDATVATATATTAAINGNYKFDITALAAATVLKSGTSLGDKVANTINPLATLNSDAAYGSSLTLGTFTVNGAVITIDSDDKLSDGGDPLNSVLDKISAATGGAVTGSYSAVTDKITLSSGSPITLGSATDTSNFLSRSRLYTNGTGSIPSLTSVGTIDTTQILNTAASRVATAVTTGDFTINGVTISVDAGVDKLQDVLDRITGSTAGVYATYDSIDDRIVLTSKTTGNIAITAANGTSNFASALKLTGAASQTTAGSDTTFTVNGGSPRVSTDNIITETESGVAGVTITAFKGGAGVTSTINISNDNSKLQNEVANFISQYNSLQNIIKSYTAVPGEDTDPADPLSILSGDSTTASIPRGVRVNITQSVGEGAIRMLEDVGVKSSGTDNLLAFSDTAKFTSALASNPTEVKVLFNKITTDLEAYINSQVDPATGALPVSVTNITATQGDIDDQIDRINESIERQKASLVASFSALEEFQARTSTIISFLQQRKTTT